MIYEFHNDVIGLARVIPKILACYRRHMVKEIFQLYMNRPKIKITWKPALQPDQINMFVLFLYLLKK